MFCLGSGGCTLGSICIIRVQYIEQLATDWVTDWTANSRPGKPTGEATVDCSALKLLLNVCVKYLSS